MTKLFKQREEAGRQGPDSSIFRQIDLESVTIDALPDKLETLDGKVVRGVCAERSGDADGGPEKESSHAVLSRSSRP